MFHQRVVKVSEDCEQASMAVVFVLNDRVCLIDILHQTNLPVDSAQMIPFFQFQFVKKVPKILVFSIIESKRPPEIQENSLYIWHNC